MIKLFEKKGRPSYEDELFNVRVLLTDGCRNLGYSSHDIISTMFKVTKTMPSLSEHSKLEFIKVCTTFLVLGPPFRIVFSACFNYFSQICNMVLKRSMSCPGNRFHAHAHPRRRPVAAPAVRLRRPSEQDQHAAESVRST